MSLPGIVQVSGSCRIRLCDGYGKSVWKSLQKAVIAGSAQAGRLTAKVMLTAPLDAARAELLS